MVKTNWRGVAKAEDVCNAAKKLFKAAPTPGLCRTATCPPNRSGPGVGLGIKIQHAVVCNWVSRNWLYTRRTSDSVVPGA